MTEILTNFWDDTVTITEQENGSITATVTDSNGAETYSRIYTGKTLDEVTDRWYFKGWRF